VPARQHTCQAQRGRGEHSMTSRSAYRTKGCYLGKAQSIEPTRGREFEGRGRLWERLRVRRGVCLNAVFVIAKRRPVGFSIATMRTSISLTGRTRRFETRLIVAHTRPSVFDGRSQLALDIPQATCNENKILVTLYSLSAVPLPARRKSRKLRRD
jgi:hypothetical protein